MEPTRELAAQYGIPHATTDLAESLALPDIEPTPEQARVLEQLLLALLLDEESSYAALEDGSGARPIHALLIANSKEVHRL